MPKAKDYCTIYVVRHGETKFNIKQIVQGQTDSSLTENGIEQARQLAKNLKTVNFNAIFSSDLYRAIHTAEVLKLDRDLKVNTTQLLRERTFGYLDGQPWEQFAQENRNMLEKREKLAEEQKSKFKLYEGYETDEEISLRMLTALREIAAAYSGQKVLVVSHGSIMRASLVHLGFASYNQLPPGSVGNTGYFVLEADGVDFFLKETQGINLNN